MTAAPPTETADPPARPTRRLGRLGRVVAAVGCAFVIAGCSNVATNATTPSTTPAGSSITATGPSGPSGTSGTSAPSATTTPVTIDVAPGTPVVDQLRAADLPVFDGRADDFYTVPEPLPAGAPGDVIRVQVNADSKLTNADVLRVMYHSTNRNGTDRAVTGFVAVPRAAAPAGGRKVISWVHGTTGIGPACAPSKTGEGDRAAQHFIDAGYVWAATDYDGLGPPGERHPYLSGVTEGRNGVDIVRAARHIPLAAAGDRWVVYGHSQGGQSALFTGQVAPTYAPELHLLGTVAPAPASALSNMGVLADAPGRPFLVFLLMGMPTDYPQLHPDDYLTPAALDAAKVVDTACGGALTLALGKIPPGGLLKANPSEVEPAKSILAENEPGHVATPVPIWIGHGLKDTTVSPASSKVLFDRQCTLGQVVTRTTYDGVDHGGVVDASIPDVDAWITARFADQPAPNGCP